MVGRKSAKLLRTIAAMNEPQPENDEFWEVRYSIRARVAHVSPRQQVEVERAARLLRLHFVNRRARSPKCGMLHWLLLVGRLADARNPEPDDFNPTALEIWAFVDHEAYKGKNRYWGIAQRAVAGELGRRATLTLSAFTIAEPARFIARRNMFLTDRYYGGIVIYDRAMDGPWDAHERARYDRITASVAQLPAEQAKAFRAYRRHGFMNDAQAESHLFDATTALIENLRMDARPRSLRPEVDSHPRYNLHLYHRPDHHDRLLAVHRYRNAVSYASMMALSFEAERLSAGIRYAAAATEFALKAVLLRDGYSDDWIRRHISLDVRKALAHALGCGLPSQPPDVQRLIGPLAHHHMNSHRPPPPNDVLAMMTPAEIARTIRGLCDAVGRTTGYHRLSGEARS